MSNYQIQDLENDIFYYQDDIKTEYTKIILAIVGIAMSIFTMLYFKSIILFDIIVLIAIILFLLINLIISIFKIPKYRLIICNKKFELLLLTETTEEKTNRERTEKLNNILTEEKISFYKKIKKYAINFLRFVTE